MVFANVDGPLIRFVVLRARSESGEAISGSGSSVPEMLPILEANHLPNNDARRAESLFELG
jgi:hypothetical protein